MAKTKQAKEEKPDQRIVEKPFNQKLEYQEWECKIINTPDGPGYEKLKLRRSRVLMTEDYANVLNKGVLNAMNSLVLMYLLPE
jgi:hypothetical protein